MIVPRILLFLTAVFWSWTFIATKIALDFMTPTEVLGWRFIIGIPLMGAIVWLRKTPLNFQRRDMKFILIGSAIITIHFLAQITALKFTSATNTGWIISVTPLAIAGLSFIFLREKISRYQVAGIIVATLGILLLVSGGDLSSLGWLEGRGDWIILATAHTWAIFTIVTRDISRKHDPLAVSLAVLLPAAVLIVGYMLFTSDWRKFLAVSTEGIIAILFLAIAGTVLAQWFWQIGIARLGAARAGFFIYLMPLSTTALAVPYLGESFGVTTAIGGVAVLGAVVWSERMTGKQNRQPRGRQ